MRSVGSFLLAALLAGPVAGAAPLSWALVEAGDEKYEAATARLDEGDWKGAIAAFDAIAKAGGRRADAALYWKAYAMHKRGQRAEALATIAALRQAHAKSEWLDDAQALEIEIRQRAGQHVAPQEQPDEDLKLMAIQGLMNSDPARAVPLLEKLLSGSHSAAVRDKALFVLAQGDSPQGREVLARVARQSADAELQRSAIRHLGIFGGDEAARLLGEIYASGTSASVKRAVLEAWMVSGDEPSVLRAARGEKDPELRADAIRQLGIMGALDAVSEMYRSETDREIREAALQAMFVGGATERMLELARTEKDPGLRRTAIRNLGLMGEAKTLTAMYATEKDAGVREAVVDALFVHGEAGPLVTLARQEKDPRLRRAIVQKLSLMDDPAATDYMLEILGEKR